VQEQAKERLHASAVEAEARQIAMAAATAAATNSLKGGLSFSQNRPICSRSFLAPTQLKNDSPPEPIVSISSIDQEAAQHTAMAMGRDEPSPVSTKFIDMTKKMKIGRDQTVLDPL